MAALVAGGGVERGGAVPGREVGAGWEAGDVADVDEQSRGAGRADAVQRQQRGAGGLDQLAQLLVGGLLPCVDPLEISNELGSDATSRLAGGVARPDLREQRLRLLGSSPAPSPGSSPTACADRLQPSQVTGRWDLLNAEFTHRAG